MLEANFSLAYPNASDRESNFSLDVDISLPANGVTAIFGASGSGKTTLLRCIAGLEPLNNGTIRLNQQVWQNGAQRTPPHRRGLGFVFQQAQLFSHLSVEENLTYGLKRKTSGRPASTADNTAMAVGNADWRDSELLQRLGIRALLQRRPCTLSGGEQQRVAIARALLTSPELLLMDEPLASLDAGRKERLLPYIETTCKALDIPTLYVSHSVDELLRLADHVVVLENGKVIKQGATLSVLNDPGIVGTLAEELGTVLDLEVVDYQPKWQLLNTRFPGGKLLLPGAEQPTGSAFRARVLARDISIALTPAEDSSMLNILPATITNIDCDQDESSATVSLLIGSSSAAQSTLLARITRKSIDQLQLRNGMAVWAQVKSVAIVR